MVPTILVTGAAGFIGSAVVRELSRQGSNVVAVDALLGGLYPPDEKSERFEGLSTLPGVEVHKLDLRTDDLRVLPSSITHIINQAAMPGLGLSWEDFDLYSSCNVVALARLIEVAQDWRIEKFVQISTSSVYGSEAIGDESQALQPVSPYGVTKLAGENLALAHWRDSGFPATILRYFSVYGPGQRPDMAYRKFIDKALRHQTITVFGSGEQSRSNTFIDDVVSGTIAALDKGAPGEVFNIAGGHERTLNEALSIIESALGHSLQIERMESARGDQIRTAGDSSKAQRILGFRNTVDLAEGLSRQVEWQRSRQ